MVVGNYLQQRLQELALKHLFIGDVRGVGLMVGMELVLDRQTKTPAPHHKEALIQACFRRGLLLLGCGQSTIRFCPPLIIAREQVDIAVAILAEGLASIDFDKSAGWR